MHFNLHLTLAPSPPCRLILFITLTSILTLLLPAPTAAASVLNDIIGHYDLLTFSDQVADSLYCPLNFTVRTFNFESSPSPSDLFVPSTFNVKIPHRVTSLEGTDCESDGSISAIQKSHPYLNDVSSALDSWSRGGWGPNAEWIDIRFLEEVASHHFIIGYDFTERVCGNFTMRSGAGFLWYQPSVDIYIDRLLIRGGTKLLLVTFSGRKKYGCIFTAKQVGGQGTFPPGPVTDNTNPGAPNNPPRTSPPPTVTPQPEIEDEPDADETNEQDNPDPDEEDASDDNETEFPEDTSDTSGNVFDDNATASDDDSGAGAACFPASATVQLSDGSIRPMSDLAIGDVVRSGVAHNSDIFFFSHRTPMPGSLYPYVSLRVSSGKAVTLSTGHYVHVKGSLVAAGRIGVGDTLSLADGSVEKVVDVQRVLAEGKFAPHTLHGDIVVNGLLVSTYTTAVHPRLAHHLLLAPLRFLYRHGLPTLADGLLDYGADRLRTLLPSGPDQLPVVS